MASAIFMRLGRDLAGVARPARWRTRSTVRLPFRCWMLRRALAHGDGRDLVERHHHVGAGDGDRQVLDVRGVDAVVGCRRTATSRDSPVGIDPVAHFDAGERHAQRLRRVVHRNAELVGEAAIELDPQLVLRILLRQAHVHGARDLPQLVHELVGDLHELARVGAVELDLHRLARAVVEVVEHHVLGADQLRRACSRRSPRDLAASALRVAAACRCRPRRGRRSALTRLLVALVSGIVRASSAAFSTLQRAYSRLARRRRAHFDGHRAVVGLGQELDAAERDLQRQRADQQAAPRSAAIHLR